MFLLPWASAHGGRTPCATEEAVQYLILQALGLQPAAICRRRLNHFVMKSLPKRKNEIRTKSADKVNYESPQKIMTLNLSFSSDIVRKADSDIIHFVHSYILRFHRKVILLRAKRVTRF